MNKRQRKKSTKSLINAAARSGKRMNALGYKAITQGKVDLASVLTEAYKSYKANAAVRRREDEIRSQMRQLETKDRSKRRGVNKNKWTNSDIRKYNNLKMQLGEIQGISPADYRGKPQYDEDITINNDQYGALIRKYEEYIDNGWIKRQDFLDKYESAQWLKEQILTQEEMEDAIRTADTWRATREAKWAEKRSNMILFNF